MQFYPTAQRSTGNLTNTRTKNILAQLKSTLFGCDIIVNLNNIVEFILGTLRAWKSSKISAPGFLLGVQCPKKLCCKGSSNQSFEPHS